MSVLRLRSTQEVSARSRTQNISRGALAALAACLIAFGGSVAVTPPLANATPLQATEGELAPDPETQAATETAESVAPAEKGAEARGTASQTKTPRSATATVEDNSISNLILEGEGALATGAAVPGSDYLVGLILSAQWDASINVRIPFFAGSGADLIDYSDYLEFQLATTEGYLSADGSVFNFELVEVDGLKYIQISNPRFADPEGGALEEYNFRLKMKPGIVPNDMPFSLVPTVYTDNSFSTAIVLQDGATKPLEFKAQASRNAWTTGTASTTYSEATKLAEGDVNRDLAPFFFTERITPSATTGNGRVWADTVSRSYTIQLPELINPGSGLKITALSGATNAAQAALTETEIPAGDVSYDSDTRQITVTAAYVHPADGRTGELPAQQYGIKIEGLHIGSVPLGTSQTVRVTSAASTSTIGESELIAVSPASIAAAVAITHSELPVAGQYVDRVRIYKQQDQVCDDGVGEDQFCSTSHTQPGNNWTATQSIYGFDNANGAPLTDFYVVDITPKNERSSPTSVTTGEYQNPGAGSSTNYTIRYTTDETVAPVSTGAGSGHYDYKNSGINWVTLAVRNISDASESLNLPAGVTAVMWDYGTVGGTSIDGQVGVPDRPNSFRVTQSPTITHTFTSDITVRYGYTSTKTVLHYVDQAYEDEIGPADSRFRSKNASIPLYFANHNLSQTLPTKTFNGCEHPGWDEGLLNVCFPTDIAKYTVTLANLGYAGDYGAHATPELRIEAPKIYDTLDEYHDASTLAVESVEITGTDARTLDPSEYTVDIDGQDFVVSFPDLLLVYRQSIVVKYTAQLQDEDFIIAADEENDAKLNVKVESKNWLTGVTVTPAADGGTEMTAMGKTTNPPTDPARAEFAAPSGTHLNVSTTTPIRRSVPSTSTQLAMWDSASDSFLTGNGRYIEEYKPVTYRLSGVNLSDTVRTKDVRADEFTLRGVLPNDNTLQLLSTDPADLKAYKTVDGVDTPIEVESIREILNPTREVVFNFPGTELKIGETISVEFQAQAQFLGAVYHSGPSYTHGGVQGLFDIDFTKQPHFSETQRAYRSVFTDGNVQQGFAEMRNPFTSDKFLQQRLGWASDNFFYGEEITGTLTTTSFQAQAPHAASVDVPVPAVGVTYSATQSFNEVTSVRVLDAAGGELLAGDELSWRVIRPEESNAPDSATETVVVEVRLNGEVIKLSDGEKLEVVFTATIKPWRLTGNTATIISDTDTRTTAMASNSFVMVSEEDPASIKPINTGSPVWAMDTADLDENADTQRLFRTGSTNTTLRRAPYTAHGIQISTDTGAPEFAGGQANRWVATVSNRGTKPLGDYYVVAAMPKEFTYEAGVVTSETDPTPWESHEPTAMFSTAQQNLLVWEFGGEDGYTAAANGAARIQFAMRSAQGIRAYEPEIYLIPADEVNEAVRQAEGAPGQAISRARVPFMAQLEEVLGSDLSDRTIIRNSLVTNSSGVLQLVYGGAKPSLADADAEDELSYTFTMGSRGAQEFGNIEVMDVFPSVGDQFISSPMKRESTVALTSTGQIEVRECNLSGTNCGDLDEDLYTVYSSTMDFSGTTVGNQRAHWDLDRLADDFGFSEGISEGATAALVVLDSSVRVQTGGQIQVEFFAQIPPLEELVDFFGDVLKTQDRFELDSLIGANSIASLQDYGTGGSLGTRLSAIETPLGITEVNLNTVGQRVWYDHLGTGVQQVDEDGNFLEPGVANARVKLQSVTDPSLSYDAVTDEDGGYQFLASKDGEYVVQVETPAVVDGVERTFSGMPNAAGADTGSGSVAGALAASRVAVIPPEEDPEFLRLRSEIVSAEVVGDTLVGTTAPFNVTRGIVNNIMYAGVTPAAPSVAYKLSPVADPTRVMVHEKSTITAVAEDQYGVPIEVPNETLRITAGLEDGDVVDGNVVTFGGVVATRTITVEADVRGVTLNGTVQVDVFAAGGPGSGDQDGSGLSTTGGQIAGLIIAGVAILVLGALAVILSILRKRRRAGDAESSE